MAGVRGLLAPFSKGVLPSIEAPTAGLELFDEGTFDKDGPVPSPRAMHFRILRREMNLFLSFENVLDKKDWRCGPSVIVTVVSFGRKFVSTMWSKSNRFTSEGDHCHLHAGPATPRSYLFQTRL